MRQYAFSTLWPRVREAATVLAIIAVVAGLGCTRRFYRNQADREVAGVLAEKDVVPDWKIENFPGAYPDGRARFADPSNPDRPPMPPDDPAAWQLSPHSQKPGKPGVARVEGDGYVRLLQYWDGMNRELEAQKRELEAQKKDPAEVVPTPLKAPVPAPQPQDDTPDPFPPVREDAAAPPGTPEHPFKINMEQCVELGL